MRSAWPARPSTAQEAQPEDLVNALNGVFGAHAKMRAAHTKGICVKGNFTPTAEAAALSKSPRIRRAGSAGRSLLARRRQPDGLRRPEGQRARHRHALPAARRRHVRPVADLGADLLGQNAGAVSRAIEDRRATKASRAEKIDAFFKANPDSTKQGAWLNARPTPASYATADYFGVHTFTLINAKGDRQPIKWKAEPAGGFVGLSDAEADGKGKDFYAGELNDRFAKGPVDFNLFAVIGQPGDQDDDPTSEWPADRKSVKMGTISITGLEPAESCDVGIFDPNNLADGVEPSKNDKILPMRSLDYAVSFGRRTN